MGGNGDLGSNINTDFFHGLNLDSNGHKCISQNHYYVIRHDRAQILGQKEVWPFAG